MPETRYCEDCNKELQDKRWFTCAECQPNEAGVLPVFCRDCMAAHGPEHEEGWEEGMSR
jgi:hypothetical protein